MACLCPVCNSATGVIDSRPSLDNTVRRRRRCSRCGFRFSTAERIISEDARQSLAAGRKQLAQELIVHLTRLISASPTAGPVSAGPALSEAAE